MQNFKTIFQDNIPVTINEEIVSCKRSKNNRTTLLITSRVCYDDSLPTKKQPDTMNASKNTDKLRGISIGYGSR